MDIGFRDLTEALPNARDEEKLQILQQINEKLASVFSRKPATKIPPESTNFLQTTIEHSMVVQIVASVMEESGHWASDVPSWIKDLLTKIYFRMMCKIPHSQTKALVEVCVKYLTNCITQTTILILACIASPHENKAHLAHDFIYNLIKKALFKSKDKNISSAALRFLHVASENCVEWQTKILEDSNSIRELLALPPSDEIWTLFGNLSHHPDAKTLFLPEVLEKAALNKKFDSCNDICAILCTETGAAQLTLDVKYMEERAQHLINLLNKQTDLHSFHTYTLLDLILPLVNLSVADANKEILGEHFISSLLRVLEIKEGPSLVSEIAHCLERSQQEAAKTLWNLAFNAKNRKLISDNRGLDVLKPFCTQTLLQSNVNGILYMLSDHTPHQLSRDSKGHVMISYSWSCQAIVLKLAQSLKDSGYLIWLDTEQMKGSTLEAMAEAIERADLVLVCMSQKYKDSPNCRLEGEYCQTRKVDVIPLIMQKGYKPDGWLGIILGAKLYHEFYDDTEWDRKINALVSEIGNRGKGKGTSLVHRSQEISPLIPPTFPTPAPPTPPTPPTVFTNSVSPKNWTSDDLLEWMKSEGIENHHEVFLKHKIDRRALLELKILLSSSSPLISSLFDRLEIKEVGEILKITAAIRNVH